MTEALTPEQIDLFHWWQKNLTQLVVIKTTDGDFLAYVRYDIEVLGEGKTGNEAIQDLRNKWKAISDGKNQGKPEATQPATQGEPGSRQTPD